MDNKPPAEPKVEIRFDEVGIRSAVRQVPEQDWVNFFEFLRYQQYNKIRSAITDVERLTVHNAIKGLDLIQNKFSELMKKPLDR